MSIVSGGCREIEELHEKMIKDLPCETCDIVAGKGMQISLSSLGVIYKNVYNLDKVFCKLNIITYNVKYSRSPRGALVPLARIVHGDNKNYKTACDCDFTIVTALATCFL